MYCWPLSSGDSSDISAEKYFEKYSQMGKRWKVSHLFPFLLYELSSTQIAIYETKQEIA